MSLIDQSLLGHQLYVVIEIMHLVEDINIEFVGDGYGLVSISEYIALTAEVSKLELPTYATSDDNPTGSSE